MTELENTKMERDIAEFQIIVMYEMLLKHGVTVQEIETTVMEAMQDAIKTNK